MDIYCGDALLVGDRCNVRGAGTGRVVEIPSLERRTYKIELDEGGVVFREWLVIDRIAPKAKLRNQDGLGRVVEWDAWPGVSCGTQTPMRSSESTRMLRDRSGRR